MGSVQFMARLQIYVRQPNAIAQTQLHELHERLPDLMWPGDSGEGIFVAYNERFNEDQVREMVREAIASGELSEISLDPPAGSTQP